MRERIVLFAMHMVCGVPVFAQLPPMPQKTHEQRGPRLFVGERVRDLGTIIEGDKVVVTWKLENKGDADLIIENTRASCGCTVVRLSDEDTTVPPGGSLDLKAEYDSRHRRGEQRISVTVYTNDPLEPMLKLEVAARVIKLYRLTPSQVVNIRSLKRGQTAQQTLDLAPSEGGADVELLAVELNYAAPLSHAVERFDTPHGPGRRISFTVLDDAPLGRLTARVTLKVAVGDVQRTRELLIRGEVVGDLTCQPAIVDETRHKSRRGRRLVPVTIRSTGKQPVEILGISAGPLLDATVERREQSMGGTAYDVHLAIRDDAPAGPFGALLEVRTNSLDQPLIRVPVFADVTAPIEVDPPLVLLRQDGTTTGTTRTVRLTAAPQESLQITDVACDTGAVEATVRSEGSNAPEYIRYLDVRLTGKLPPGTHESKLRLQTRVAGAQQLEIPLTIIVTDSGRQK
ncbi:MAG: DUF1573 domain-containing protein [Phycisphaerae bacterium]